MADTNGVEGGGGEVKAPPQKYIPPSMRKRMEEEEARKKAGGGGGAPSGDRGGDRGGDRWGGGGGDRGDRWGGGRDGGDDRWGGGRGGGGDRWGGGGDRGGGGERWGGGGRDFGGDRWGGSGGGGGRRGNSAREDAEIESLFESTRNASGINFDKYDEIPVEVVPTMEQLEIPVIDTFQEAHDLAGAVMENINRAGYTKPTPVQKHALPILVAGHDIMACAQTGSGKTAAFLFPMISVILKKGGNSDRGARCSYPAGLILAPTRELVQQIYDEARKFCYKTGLRCAVAYGGGENIRDQLRAVEMGADIVVAAPGRLVDFMERGKVKLPDIMFLTLDEADRMLDMGFEPQIRQIVEGGDG